MKTTRCFAALTFVASALTFAGAASAQETLAVSPDVGMLAVHGTTAAVSAPPHAVGPRSTATGRSRTSSAAMGVSFTILPAAQALGAGVAGAAAVGAIGAVGAAGVASTGAVVGAAAAARAQAGARAE